MKECPLCHTRYDDTQNFCINDGSKLVDVAPQPAKQQTVTPAPARENAKSPKKKLLTALVVVALAGLGAYHYINYAATYLRIEPETIHLAKNGAISQYAGIDYNGYIWKVNHCPEWVNVYKEGKTKLKIMASDNDTGSQREGTITVQSGSQISRANVIQSAFATYIKPSVEELKFPKEGGTKTVEIESDGIGYTFEPIREAKIKVDELRNLTVTVGPLDGITAAWGTNIVLREDNVECTISISQADWY